MKITLETPLTDLGAVSPNYSKLLKKQNLETVQDLLWYFPNRYDDFSKIVPVSEEYLGETITVSGTVQKTKINRIWKRKMTIIEASLETSDSVMLKAIWFNQPFILSTVQEGKTIRLSGKLEKKGRTFQMVGPAFERSARATTHTARLVPIYKETKGLTSKWLRWQISNFLSLTQEIPDIVPQEIYQKFHLFSLGKAIRELHFPSSTDHLLIAQKTLAFQEMFLLQVKALQIKNLWQEKKSVAIEIKEKEIQEFIQSLPFALTTAQKKSIQEIFSDLKKKIPMNRLLNGDVGSGKTVVAGASAFPVLKNDLQVALMAPTEVLARQHFESFCRLFKNYDFSIALFSGSYKITNQKNDTLKSYQKREDLLKKIKTGEIKFVIGTHALIQKDVHFKNLALVIIDEQHRFGVAQRATLQKETLEMDDGNKKSVPHLLTMTATPIPRSLSIAYFGSLDISVLDEMPKNRKPVETKIISSHQRNQVYAFGRKEIAEGRQAFIILPLVEDSQSLANTKSVKAEHQRLAKEIFPELKLGLLHGQMKPDEKEKTMQKFKNNQTQILVSTSVVEVGVDIPNASIMIIENAERFGLSQLHQFRGRVGRGEFKSHCFLFSDSESATVCQRLKILEKNADGFKIAEKDLELRGPGQFFGTIQSGLPDVSMQNITNLKLVKLAREEAEIILKEDSELKKFPAIKKALKKFEEQVHLE